MKTTTPILFLIFNRPDTTRRVLEEIRKARPTHLFVAADGPRAHRPGDAEACRETRAIIDAIDWPCTVEKLYREENLGCKKAVENAVTWFFGKVDEGIILEDDCLPDQTFFTFASEMLEHYRTNPSVMLVSGSNLGGTWRGPDSYFFSAYSNIWGWATWKRAWQAYDPAMTSWKDMQARERVRERIGSPSQWKVKQWAYGAVHSGKKDSWAYAWEYAVLANGGFSVVPRVNLIENIGWSGEATHTSGKPKEFVFPKQSISFPLAHPAQIAADRKYDAYFIKKVFTGRLITMKRVANLLRRIGKRVAEKFRRIQGMAKRVHVIRPNRNSSLYYLVQGSIGALKTAVDVGCGFDADFSMFMIKTYGMKAFGVDPTRKHAVPLQKLQSDSAGAFTYVPLAVSSENGTISFNESVENVSGSILEDHRNVRNQLTNKYEVESCNLRSLPARLGLDRIEYIKLDLEGAEYGLIDSVQPGDLARYDQLFIEFHHHAVPSFSEQDTLNAVRAIESEGFKSYTLTGRDYLFYR